jgi:HEAT repeat protein
VQVGKAAQLFAAKALWQATGLRSAGRALVRALGSSDDDIRTLAGMFLVQGGKKAAPLLDEALRRREYLPLVLTLLGDLGDPRYEPALRAFAADPDPAVAESARQALKVLEYARGAGAGANASPGA